MVRSLWYKRLLKAMEIRVEASKYLLRIKFKYKTDDAPALVSSSCDLHGETVKVI